MMWAEKIFFTKGVIMPAQSEEVLPQEIEAINEFVQMELWPGIFELEFSKSESWRDASKISTSNF